MSALLWSHVTLMPTCVSDLEKEALSLSVGAAISMLDNSHSHNFDRIILSPLRNIRLHAD